MKTLYTQVSMKRRISDTGNEVKTCWIPSKFAKVGNSLKLRTDTGWELGWIVTHEYQERYEDQLPDAHAEVKAHRRNTGDSDKKQRNNDSRSRRT
jgi:hypothetical protein